MRGILAALLFLWAGLASAATSTLGSTQFIADTVTLPIAKNSGQFDTRDVFVCFIPDVQHLTAPWSYTRALETYGRNCAIPPIYNVSVDMACDGGNCTTSPYCQGSWVNTGERMLYNMAYEMSGQYEKIDWRGISNLDDTRSSPSGPFDHPRCDIVVSLGDMSDQSTFTQDDPNITDPVVADDTACDALPVNTRHQYTETENFWNILKAAGVTIFPLRGNHDNQRCFRDLMARLGFAAGGLSYYFDSDDDDDALGAGGTRGNQFAIKVPTTNSKFICVVGMDDENVNGKGDDGITPSGDDGPNSPAEDAWVLARIGCGGNFPTILVQHGGIANSTCTPTAGGLNFVFADASTPEIMIGAGGHIVSPSQICKTAISSRTCSATGCFGIFSNWQDTNRHVEAVHPYGMTVMDSIGGMYTVARIMPVRGRISIWDWSVYYHTRVLPAGITATGVTTTTLDAAFNFDGK